MTSADPRLERWLEALLAEPGLTAVSDPALARRVHVHDALAAAALVHQGPVVDVGSGGGSPGIPIASARPELEVDLLEAQKRACAFLEPATAEFPNVRVVWGRAEEHGRGEGREAYGTAVAQALAPPPAALEWCLPLVREGGRVILLTGEVDPGTDPGDASLNISTTSVSAADTTGVMRQVDGQYIYNLHVPTAAVNALFTVRVRPFGATGGSMYAVLKIRR